MIDTTAQRAANAPAAPTSGQTTTDPPAPPQTAAVAQETGKDELADLAVIQEMDRVEASGKPRPSMEEMRKSMLADKAKPRGHK